MESITMTLEPEEIEKIYFLIGEVAEMLGEPSSKIRFWCTEFGIETKRVHGQRRYQKEEIELLRKIQSHINVDGQHLWKIKELYLSGKL